MPEPSKCLTIAEWRRLLEQSWNDEQSDLEWGHLRGQRAEFGVRARAALPALLAETEAAEQALADLLRVAEAARAVIACGHCNLRPPKYARRIEAFDELADALAALLASPEPPRATPSLIGIDPGSPEGDRTVYWPIPSKQEEPG